MKREKMVAHMSFHSASQKIASVVLVLSNYLDIANFLSSVKTPDPFDMTCVVIFTGTISFLSSSVTSAGRGLPCANSAHISIVWQSLSKKPSSLYSGSVLLKLQLDLMRLKLPPAFFQALSAVSGSDIS